MIYFDRCHRSDNPELEDYQIIELITFRARSMVYERTTHESCAACQAALDHTVQRYTVNYGKPRTIQRGSHRSLQFNNNTRIHVLVHEAALAWVIERDSTVHVHVHPFQEDTSEVLLDDHIKITLQAQLV